MAARDDQEVQRAWILGILTQLQGQDWFGTLTIMMEKGVIKRIERKEVELPPARTCVPAKV